MGVSQLSRGLWATPAHSIDTWWAYGTVNGSAIGTSAAAAVWPSANLIIYTPVRVKSRVVARKMWFLPNTTGTNNIDIGIYDRDGTRLVSSGAVAKVAASTEQVVDITDTTIGPGLYYLALTCVSGTATFTRYLPTAPVQAAQGSRTQAGAGTLPDPATWTVPQTLNYFTPVGIFTEPTAT